MSGIKSRGEGTEEQLVKALTWSPPPLGVGGLQENYEAQGSKQWLPEESGQDSSDMCLNL